MSTVTRADDKLNSARQHLKDAIQDLNEIVVLECWGYDDFKDEYYDRIVEAYHITIDAKRKLTW